MHISCKNLTKQYNNKLAVDDISLDITPGKILALLGPNGAGKSTLIKMLTGQLHPSSGSIYIDGQEYDTFPVQRRWELGIMPQDIVVWDDLNIQENLEFSASIYKLSANQAKIRVAQIIEDLKLQPEINTLAKNLSGGYKRRLNLAISIIHDPKVIFLDEPTPGIDAQSRILLTDYIQKLASTGNYSILLTDHYLEEAEKLADYVVIVDAAKVITEGTVSQLKAKHGQGNLLQVHLNPQNLGESQKIVELFAKSFENPKMVKETVTMLVSDQAKSLTRALEIVQKYELDMLNINIKEPSLEDIFLLLTGKEVRE